MELTVDEIRQNAVRAMAAQRDAVIRKAITDRIGEGWTPDDLMSADRLSFTVFQSGFQSVILDGETILELHPGNSFVSGPDSHGVTALTTQQQYRVR